MADGKADAQERTDALAQIAGGATTTAEGLIRMMAAEVKLGTHKALGMERDEWTEYVDKGRLRYTISADRDARREVVAELTTPVDAGGEGLSNREAAAVLGVDETTVRRDGAAFAAPDEPEPASAAEPANTTAAFAAPDEPESDEPTEAEAERQRRRDAAAEETRVKREASRRAQELADAIDLRYGDAREVLADVPNASISLVLTDPPYGDEAEPLYEWLAEWSSRVLMPGGSLIVYTGQSRLDRDMRIFGDHLRYWWLLSMLHTRAQMLPGKFVRAEFKPVLWYVKDYRQGRELVDDVLRPPASSINKDEHKWGQGEGGATFLIEKLTRPGEWIADPFSGTGTWGRMAAEAGRRWIGAELIRDASERAAGKIAAG